MEIRKAMRKLETGGDARGDSFGRCYREHFGDLIERLGRDPGVCVKGPLLN